MVLRYIIILQVLCLTHEVNGLETNTDLEIFLYMKQKHPLNGSKVKKIGSGINYV